MKEILAKSHQQPHRDENWGCTEGVQSRVGLLVIPCEALILQKWSASFMERGPVSKYFQFCLACGVSWLLTSNIIAWKHSQRYLNEQAWLCSNKTLWTPRFDFYVIVMYHKILFLLFFSQSLKCFLSSLALQNWVTDKAWMTCGSLLTNNSRRKLCLGSWSIWDNSEAPRRHGEHKRQEWGQ